MKFDYLFCCAIAVTCKWTIIDVTEQAPRKPPAGIARREATFWICSGFMLLLSIKLGVAWPISWEYTLVQIPWGFFCDIIDSPHCRQFECLFFMIWIIQQRSLHIPIRGVYYSEFGNSPLIEILWSHCGFCVQKALIFQPRNVKVLHLLSACLEIDLALLVPNALFQ